MLLSGLWKPPPQRRGPCGAASLPNVLTYLRILAVPAVVLCLFLIPGDAGPLVGARRLRRRLHHRLARRLPGPRLAPAVAAGTHARPDRRQAAGRHHPADADPRQHHRPASTWRRRSIILCREILVSGLREFLAELNVRVHVTQLAKWKTTMQMIALGVLLAGPAGDKIVPGVTWTRPGHAVDGGAADAVDRLRLSEGGGAHGDRALGRPASADPACR